MLLRITLPPRSDFIVKKRLDDLNLLIPQRRLSTRHTVPDPTEEERAASFNAMENPYPWTDASRVPLNAVPGTVR